MEQNFQTVVTSPMRTGSTWVCEVIESTCETRKKYLDEEESFKICSHGNWTPTDVLCKSHFIFPEYFQRLLNNNPLLKIIRVRRSIRDALSSRFYFARYHMQESDLRSDVFYIDSLSDQDLLEHLIRKSSIIHKWRNDILRFDLEIDNHDRLLDVTYEELRIGFDMVKICDFLEEDFYLFDKALEQQSFKRKQRLEKEKFKRDGKALFRREGSIGKGAELFTDNLYELLIE